MLKEEFEVRKRPWAFGAVPLVPSAFSPAFSSCSLTTSFMCCHWGSPSPISWTLTSPPGLLPVLYLVILILTWSSAACSGLTRQKRDKHHSWPYKQSAGPQDGGATRLKTPSGNNTCHSFRPLLVIILQRNALWLIICKIIWWVYWVVINVWADVRWRITQQESHADEIRGQQLWMLRAVCLPGWFGTRLRLVLCEPLARWLSPVCSSGSCSSFSSNWSSSLSSVVSSSCVALVRSNSPLSPSVSNSSWAYVTVSNHHQSRALFSYTWFCWVGFAHKPHLWCCQTPSASPP